MGEEEPTLRGPLGLRDRPPDRRLLGGGDGAADLLVAHGRLRDLTLGAFARLDLRATLITADR